MKAKKIISITLAAMLMLSANVFAAVASSDIIALDNFESYAGELSGWTKPSTYGSVTLAETERGMSVKTQKTSSDGWHEVQKTFSATGAGVTNVAYSCSLKFDGTPSMYFYTKSNVCERWLVQIDAGKITIGSETSEAVIESGKWYDFYIEYNMKTGYIRCSVTDGVNNIVFDSMAENAANNSGLWRISMALRAKTTLYFDNAHLVSLKYDVKPYAEQTAAENFDSFTSESGTAAPGDDWQTEGAAADAATLTPAGDEGKSLKMYSNGEGDFSLSKTLKSLSGNVLASFDLKLAEGSSVNLGISGTDDGGEALGDLYPVKITSDGKVLADEAEIGTVLKDTFYNVTFKFNTDSAAYSVSFKNSDGTEIKGSGAFNAKKLTGFKFLIPASEKASEIYIDNVLFKVLGNEGISKISPAGGYIDAATDEILVHFSESIADDAISSIKASVNGDEKKIESIEQKDGAVTFSLASALDFGETYIFEFSGVTLKDGSEHGGRILYYTQPLCTITDFGFSKDKIEAGELSGSAKVSCDSGLLDSAMLMLVIYEADTNKIAAQHFVTSAVSETAVQLSCLLQVPDDGKSYKAILYLWDDMFNMLSLCQAAELK